MIRSHLALLLLIGLAGIPVCRAQQLSGVSQTQPHTASTGGIITGEWAAEFRTDTGTVHLMIHRRIGASGSDKRFFRLALYRLEGLATALPIQNDANLKFQLKRDAGTFLFEGIFKGGNGSGNYTYVPDLSFINKMREFGYNDISSEDQFMMAVHDIGNSLAQDLKALKGGPVPFDELTRIGREGVNSDYIRELRASGIEPKSEKQLADMRQHGVSDSFIKDIEAMGYERASAEELINLRCVGVTVDFIKGMEAIGYKHPPLDKLAQLRLQGATINFIKELQAMGYNPPIDQLLGMKLFGVTPEFIREVESYGYRELPINLITCLCIQGITIDFMRQATDIGRKRISLRELVKLRNPNGQSKGSCELQVFPDWIPH